MMMRKIKDDEFSIEMLLEKSNPLQEKYYYLTRNEDENIAKELIPNSDDT